MKWFRQKSCSANEATAAPSQKSTAQVLYNIVDMAPNSTAKTLSAARTHPLYLTLNKIGCCEVAKLLPERIMHLDGDPPRLRPAVNSNKTRRRLLLRIGSERYGGA